MDIILNWFRQLFGKHEKSNEELEDEFTEQLIQENEERLRDAYEQMLPSSVIMYRYNESNDNVHPIILIENFTCKMLPEPKSIIWIAENDILRPFKVIRFDFMQTDNEYDSMKVYIVVHPAMNNDIVTYN